MTENTLSIGMPAPDFEAMSTFGNIKLSDFLGSWVVLFSHPGDFTPVCTTEFIAFSEAAEEFAKRNTQLLGLSTDSNPSHLAWTYAIKMTTGVSIPFPVVADRGGEVARLYGMNTEPYDKHQLVRNVFIIDPDAIIRTILIYPSTNGRNVKEILRILTALQLTDSENVLTPANWNINDAVMYPAPSTYRDLQMKEDEIVDDENSSCKDWYWCYKHNNKELHD